jgi:hypothetical protein
VSILWFSHVYQLLISQFWWNYVWTVNLRLYWVGLKIFYILWWTEELHALPSNQQYITFLYKTSCSHWTLMQGSLLRWLAVSLYIDIQHQYDRSFKKSVLLSFFSFNYYCSFKVPYHISKCLALKHVFLSKFFSRMPLECDLCKDVWKYYIPLERLYKH